VLEAEQDRIVSDTRPDEPLGRGGSPGKTHCYQGLRVKVTGDQVMDRAKGSAVPLPTVTARYAERLIVGSIRSKTGEVFSKGIFTVLNE
jgi:hypothetical protein